MFEGAIWFFLIVVGAALIDITTKYGRKIFKQWLLLLVVIVLSFSWGVIFYGSFVEPRFLVVHQETIEMTKIDQPIKVALLSDFHLGPYKGNGWVEEVVAKTNKQNSDLILLLGDYIFGPLGKADDLSALADLTAPLGVYAVLGNHDYDTARQEEIKSKLEAMGIKVLFDSSDKIKLSDGKFLCLAGVNDLWNGGQVKEAVADCSDETTILMSHNPDAVFNVQSFKVDLLVSGHTHGGQIRLPLIGPVAFIPTILSKEYSEGLFDFSGTKLFITSGLGEMGPRARLFNPPEIVILELK